MPLLYGILSWRLSFFYFQVFCITYRLKSIYFYINVVVRHASHIAPQTTDTRYLLYSLIVYNVFGTCRILSSKCRIFVVWVDIKRLYSLHIWFKWKTANCRSFPGFLQKAKAAWPLESMAYNGCALC